MSVSWNSDILRAVRIPFPCLFSELSAFFLADSIVLDNTATRPSRVFETLPLFFDKILLIDKARDFGFINMSVYMSIFDYL